jgi:hypothetical protein
MNIAKVTISDQRSPRERLIEYLDDLENSPVPLDHFGNATQEFLDQVKHTVEYLSGERISVTWDGARRRLSIRSLD